MLKQSSQDTNNNQTEDSFDDLMASLLVLVTHQTLTHCRGTLPPIVERLNKLCSHSELEYYPEQMRVLAKMRHLWETKLFASEFSQLKH